MVKNVHAYLMHLISHMLLLIAIGINRLTENGPTSFKLSARPDTKTSVQKNMKKNDSSQIWYFKFLVIDTFMNLNSSQLQTTLQQKTTNYLCINHFMKMHCF